MNIDEIKNNLNNINYIILGGSKSINLDNDSSDYDIIVNTNSFILIKKYVYNSNKIEFFTTGDAQKAWPLINNLMYDINKENLIFKNENYDFNYKKENIKIVFQEFKKSLIIENDIVVAYKNSSLLTWLFTYYFHYIEGYKNQDFILNYKNSAKPLMFAEILKDSETLSILNSIKNLIESI
jgi:hypothetical protein